MIASDVAATLREAKPRFLEGLAPHEIGAIVAAGTKRQFKARALIANEGDPAEHLVLMLNGSARNFCMSPQGEKIVIRWIRAGEVANGAALLSMPVEYLVSTEAVRDGSLLMWNRAAIRSLAGAYPRLMENALLVAYDYMVLYKTLHIAASCQTATQRLAQVLGSLAKGMGKRGPRGIELHVRNEELANEANVTIFTVSRLLGEWQRKGLLVKSRGKVLVRLPEELSRSEWAALPHT
jgi:CRP-like cAMP-binding protein